jgi:hypothetical protein
MAVEMALGAGRARAQVAAAIRAGAGERSFDAGAAEGAFERADMGVEAVRRQIDAAALAIGAEL